MDRQFGSFLQSWIKYRLTIAAVELPGYSNELKAYVYTKAFTWMFIAVF